MSRTPSPDYAYPLADNTFYPGDVIRNYHLYDKEDDEHYICEFADGTNQLMLFLIVGGL